MTRGNARDGGVFPGRTTALEMKRTTARERGEKGGRWRAEAATARRPLARGFTLTELLIVIGLIVLVLALAVPAFQAMTGGRSIDAATNQLSAILGAARSEAIGLQKTRGVFFYLDPATERVNVAMVREVGVRPEVPQDDPLPDIYLDLVPERDPIALPVGVGLQGIDNSDVTAGGTSTTAGTRRDDGYIGYNPVTISPAPPQGIRYGGVILFDGYGRLINKRYAFHLGQGDPSRPTQARKATDAGAVFGYVTTGGTNAPPPPPQLFIPRQDGAGNSAEKDQPPRSLFGFVLYDAEPFRGRGSTPEDPQVRGGAFTTEEQDEEKWLDQNGLPVLINRYNGTLVRGE